MKKVGAMNIWNGFNVGPLSSISFSHGLSKFLCFHFFLLLIATVNRCNFFVLDTIKALQNGIAIIQEFNSFHIYRNVNFT